MFSDPAISRLKHLEKLIGTHLPPALREWYGLDGGIDLLERYSNHDYPLSLTSLAEDRDKHLRQSHLIFMIETQGVCHWAVRLDESDDPPVVVQWRDDDPTEWQTVTARFSDFIYFWIWDHARTYYHIQAIGKPLSETDLQVLRDHYHELLSTATWPEMTNYRFVEADRRLLIWTGEDQANWYLWSDNLETLEALIRTLWTRIDMPEWVIAMTPDRAIEKAVEQMLADFRI